LPGWLKLGHDFSPIGHQNALSQPHSAKVFTELVLEVTDADGSPDAAGTSLTRLAVPSSGTRSARERPC
jgi:hypothetical protein